MSNRRPSRAQGHGRNARGRRGPRSRSETEPADHWSRLLDPGQDNDFLEITACTACGALPASILGRLGPSYLRKCRECSVVYLTPRLSESVREEMERRTPGHLDSPRNLLLRHLMAERLQNMHREMFSLEGVARGSADLLEIGAGWGHFLQLCRPHYGSVDGLEMSRDRATFARERFDLEIGRTDIFREPWPGKYHLVVAWDFIDRTPYPAHFLERAHEHLLPGGQLVLSAPNYDSLFRRLLGTRWYHFDPARNLSYFTPATLKALLHKAGFADIRIVAAGKSLLREKFGGNNQVDHRLGTREQWLDALRAREQMEAEREAAALDQSHSSQTAWHGSIRRMVDAAIERSLGDQMRIYARRD